MRSARPTIMATAVLILLIERHGWDVRVRDGDHELTVRAVHPERGIAYLQAFRGDQPTDKLLRLPRW
jgi:hypothetical protein